jgi:hypothetical protein
MQCQLKDKEEAMAVFQQIFSSPQVSAEPIFECFNVLVQNKLYNIALNLGGHILRTLDKFISDVP